MSYISNSANLKILKALPDRKSRAALFAGGRATTGKITQVEGKSSVHRYVGKVRGVVVCGPNDEHIFDTPEQALEAAHWYLEDCKKEAAI